MSVDGPLYNLTGLELAELIRRGMDTSEQDYQDARGLLASVEFEMRSVFDATPMLLTPAAPGPAPAGPSASRAPR